MFLEAKQQVRLPSCRSKEGCVLNGIPLSEWKFLLYFMVAGATEYFVQYFLDSWLLDIKTPLHLGNWENSYKMWKQELEMWVLVTDMKKEKQAIAVVLSLKGQAKAIALEIDKALLNAVTGVDYLLSVLDPIFKKNETDILYS